MDNSQLCNLREHLARIMLYIDRQFLRESQVSQISVHSIVRCKAGSRRNRFR